MSSAFKLSLPVDIPWKRVCVTNDMLDRVVCDEALPPKWNTSIAVFRYDPEEEYQNYPDYQISYLKVAVTLTGYQPRSEEIQGEIDWDGLDITTLEGVTELLQSYHPCHGAIVQVTVGPKGKRPKQRLDDYPFFMDFEPKKRELYEQATDTNERQSRSIQSLSVGKSAGTTQSLEVLDIDMGGSTSFGAQASYAGTGGGFNYGSSSAGQWGTRSLNTDQSMVSRTTEQGTEKRETQSFTTQLSQLYHLLDAYHIGTNRAIFFVQPRPHVLEEPSGFVRGPRPVEGIQEFFLVVAQRKDSEDYCVSVRVDTSHLTETDILDYDTKTDISDLANASAKLPSKNDIPDGTTTREACFIGCWDVTYNCFRTRDDDDQVYTAPDGYLITGYNDLVRETHHGSTSVTVAPGNKTMTVHAEAGGHICFEGSGVCVDCDDEIEKWAGYARRQVQVNLRSDLPIRKVGTQEVMLITTRGLCCCEDEPGFFDRPFVSHVVDIPATLGGRLYTSKASRKAIDATELAGAASSDNSHIRRDEVAHLGRLTALSDGDGGVALDNSVHHNGLCKSCAPIENISTAERRISIRQANGVTEFMRQEMVKSLNPTTPADTPKPYVETDLFARKLEMMLRRSRSGRKLLTRNISKSLPDGVAKAISKDSGKSATEITAIDLLRYKNFDLSRKSGIGTEKIAIAKQRALGLGIKSRSDKDTPSPKSAK